MDFKPFLILIFSFALGCHAEDADLECVFENRAGFGYACVLDINNPNGFNNFSAIGGSHFSDKTNMDVRLVITKSDSQTANIPSIICRTFRFLSEINFENSKLTEVGDDSFTNCEFLKTINLQKNFITKIAENAFEPVRQLDTLRLNDNYLEDLPKGMLRPLRNLETMNISNNFLRIIQTDIFGSHPGLTSIFISNNYIDAVSPAIFDSVPQLQTLNLQNNICTNEFLGSTLTVEQRKEKIQKCLDNYANQPVDPIPPPGSCSRRDVFDRVCELEALVGKHEEAIEELKRVIAALSNKLNA